MVDATLTAEIWLDMQIENQRASLEELLAQLVKERQTRTLPKGREADINRAITDIRDQLAAIRRLP